jgi:hypothetical protein
MPASEYRPSKGDEIESDEMDERGMLYPRRWTSQDGLKRAAMKQKISSEFSCSEPTSSWRLYFTEQLEAALASAITAVNHCSNVKTLQC